MKRLLIIFLLLFSTNAVAKEVIWECLEWTANTYYKLDTDVPSVAQRVKGEWKYFKDVVYDEESENLNNGYQVWDLYLKKMFIDAKGMGGGGTFSCADSRF